MLKIVVNCTGKICPMGKRVFLGVCRDFYNLIPLMVDLWSSFLTNMVSSVITNKSIIDPIEVLD